MYSWTVKLHICYSAFKGLAAAKRFQHSNSNVLPISSVSELESGVVCSVLHIEKHVIVLLLTQSMQQEIQSVHSICTCILFSLMFNKFDSEILVSMK